MRINICNSSVHRSTLLCVQAVKTCNNRNTSFAPSTVKEQKCNKTCKVTVVSESCEMCPVPRAGDEELVKRSGRHSFFRGLRSSAATCWYYLEKLSVFGEFSVNLV